MVHHDLIRICRGVTGSARAMILPLIAGELPCTNACMSARHGREIGKFGLVDACVAGFITGMLPNMLTCDGEPACK